MKVVQFARVAGSSALEILDRLQERLEDVLQPLTTPDEPKELEMINGWESYPGFMAFFYKTITDMVYLHGIIRYPAGGSSSPLTPADIYTLPEGYRPNGQRTFLTLSGGTADVGRVDVYKDGRVRLVKGVNGGFSLDPVHFRAEK
jgi:hypothetical protein